MKTFEGYRKGVNLGGWFSQCDYTEERYQNFIREEDFAVIRSWGADHVRVPVDYNLLENEDGSFRESGFRHLEDAFRWAGETGLNLIVDLHKTAGFSFDPDEKEAGFFDNEVYQERFYRLWVEITKRFGRYADRAAFELLNEVTEKEFMPAWNRIARECIRRIRVYAPEISILVGGYWHNNAASVKDIDVPEDRHLVYNFHCYDPHIFTHQGAYWMPPMDTSFRISVNATFGEMAAACRKMIPFSADGFLRYPEDAHLSVEYFTGLFAEAVEAAEKRGVPLYCGEYGVIDNSKPEEALQWFRLIHEAFEHYGIGRAAWSYRQMDFGLSDARMDGVREELLKCL